MGRKLRVLIADGHPIFRMGLKEVLSSKHRGLREGNFLHEETDVIGEASDGQTALELLRREKPDLAIMDVSTSGMDGLEVANAVKNERLPVAIIFLTALREQCILDRALELGVMGYVLKENVVDEIVECVQAVSEGRYFISPAMSSLLVRKIESRSAKDRIPVGIETLTSTERRILRYVAEIKTSIQIARDMSISVKTVQNHRNNIVSKLGLQGNMALLKFAIEHKSML